MKKTYETSMMEIIVADQDPIETSTIGGWDDSGDPL